MKAENKNYGLCFKLITAVNENEKMSLDDVNAVIKKLLEVSEILGKYI